MRATVTVSTDGKVTVPKPIRESMDIEKGDVIQIEVIDAE